MKRQLFLFSFIFFTFTISACALKPATRELIADKGGWFSKIGEVSLSESPETFDSISLYTQNSMPFKAKIYRVSKTKIPLAEISEYYEKTGPKYDVITGMPKEGLEKKVIKKIISQNQAKNLFEIIETTKLSKDELKKSLNCFSHNVYYVEMRKKNIISSWSIPSCGSAQLNQFITDIEADRL